MSVHVTKVFALKRSSSVVPNLAAIEEQVSPVTAVYVFTQATWVGVDDAVHKITVSSYMRRALNTHTCRDTNWRPLPNGSTVEEWVGKRNVRSRETKLRAYDRTRGISSRRSVCLLASWS